MGIHERKKNLIDNELERKNNNENCYLRACEWFNAVSVLVVIVFFFSCQAIFPCFGYLVFRFKMSNGKHHEKSISIMGWEASRLYESSTNARIIREIMNHLPINGMDWRHWYSPINETKSIKCNKKFTRRKIFRFYLWIRTKANNKQMSWHSYNSFMPDSSIVASVSNESNNNSF